MKTCKNCRSVVDDAAKFCPDCGSADFEQTQSAETTGYYNADTANAADAVVPPVYPAAPTAAEAKTPENHIAGIVGAFLFALAGGVLYAVLYQFGYIAGICGLISFVLANFGYDLFATRRKGATGIFGAVTAIIVTVLMIALAEYVCIGIDIYNVYKEEYAITIFDALRSVPAFFEERDLVVGVLRDLGIAYALTLLASARNIAAAINSKKKPKQSNA
ncbi:MAG: hypothetical protein IJ766_06315 [Clostridia bacterium]|nr:hypothetical protein [Clostridia bacterium]